MFFKKNKPAPQAEPKAAPSMQPSASQQGHSLFAPAINPTPNTAIDFGFGQPHTGHARQPETSMPPAYAPPPEPMPWETPQLSESLEAPATYPFPESTYSEPATIEPTGPQSSAPAWEISPEPPHATPTYEAPPMTNTVPVITPDLSPEQAWALMEPNFPQQPVPEAEVIRAPEPSQPYLQETFENYTPSITQAEQPEAPWPDHSLPASFEAYSPTADTFEMASAAEMPSSESFQQDFPGMSFGEAVSPASAIGFDPLLNETGFSLEAAEQLLQQAPQEWAMPADSAPSAPASAYTPPEPVSSQPLDDFSWGATELGEAPAFEQIPLEPGAFLDSINQQLYPQDPFHSPDSEPGLSEQAFEEAAQFLFPETMAAPLDWSDESKTEPVAAEHSTWDDLAFSSGSLELGSSFPAETEAFSDVSSGLEPAIEAIDLSQSFQPIQAVPSLESELSQDLGAFMPSSAEITPPNDFFNEFEPAPIAPQSLVEPAQPPMTGSVEMMPNPEASDDLGFSYSSQAAAFSTEIDSMEPTADFEDFSAETVFYEAGPATIPDFGASAIEGDVTATAPTGNTAWESAEAWLPDAELPVASPLETLSASPAQSIAPELPLMEPEFDTPAYDLSGMATIDSSAPLKIEENLYAIEANLSFSDEESWDALPTASATESPEYTAEDTWFSETPATIAGLSLQEDSTEPLSWANFTEMDNLSPPEEPVSSPTANFQAPIAEEDDDFYATAFTLNEQGELIPALDQQPAMPASSLFEASEGTFEPEAGMMAMPPLTLEPEQASGGPEQSIISSTAEFAQAGIEDWDFEASASPATPQPEAPFFPSFETEQETDFPAQDAFKPSPTDTEPTAFEGPSVLNEAKAPPLPPMPEAAQPLPNEPPPAAPSKLPPVPPPSRFNFKPKTQFTRTATPKPNPAIPTLPDELEAQWLNPSPAASPEASKPQHPQVAVEELMLGNLEVLSICPLSPEKRLLVVQSKGIFALMGQSGVEQPQISVLKLFEQNPIAYQNTFTAVEEAQAAAQGMYVVQVGTWHAIISTFQDKITLHTELG